MPNPLGMVDTHFWLPIDKEPRRAMITLNGKSDLPSRYSQKGAAERTNYRGSTGLHSTAFDYWKFCQILLNGGKFEGVRYLSPRTVDRMTSDHLQEGVTMWNRPSQRRRVGFGSGVAVNLDYGDTTPMSPGSYYWGGSQGTTFWIDRSEQLIGILMMQTDRGDRPIRNKFTTLTYAAVMD